MAAALHHIGIAVRGLRDAVRRWSTILGTDPDRVEIEEVPEEGVRIAFL
ncbi:MAG: methylmalonyl-CoA epimerase, partial [Planctomycetota bacterium]